jgi:hypothetical protein
MRQVTSKGSANHRHFQERLPIGVDVAAFTDGERPRMRSLLEKAVRLAERTR